MGDVELRALVVNHHFVVDQLPIQLVRLVPSDVEAIVTNGINPGVVFTEGRGS